MRIQHVSFVSAEEYISQLGIMVENFVPSSYLYY